MQTESSNKKDEASQIFPCGALFIMEKQNGLFGLLRKRNTFCGCGNC